MKKLSLQQQLITSKYKYPAYCTTFDKEGNATSYRVVTHSIRATEDLRKLYPSLKNEINRITEDREAPYKPFSLGELGK